jgi:hypothetical protein
MLGGARTAARRRRRHSAPSAYASVQPNQACRGIHPSASVSYVRRRQIEEKVGFHVHPSRASHADETCILQGFGRAPVIVNNNNDNNNNNDRPIDYHRSSGRDVLRQSSRSRASLPRNIDNRLFRVLVERPKLARGSKGSRHANIRRLYLCRWNTRNTTANMNVGVVVVVVVVYNKPRNTIIFALPPPARSPLHSSARSSPDAKQTREMGTRSVQVSSWTRAMSLWATNHSRCRWARTRAWSVRPRCSDVARVVTPLRRDGEE